MTSGSSFANLRRSCVIWVRPAELLDAKTGERVFGVEYRVASDQGRTYFSALNQLKNVLW